ncbi:MAG: DUF1848 family protein [Acutalibacter sp.]
MILSASRRTDCPPLWPLAAGPPGGREVLIPQPYRARHATRLLFSPETVDAIVFWTKTPSPFCPAGGGGSSGLPGLSVPVHHHRPGYTLGARLHPCKNAWPPLSSWPALGPRRVDWRFDPILLDSQRPRLVRPAV